MYYDCSSNLVHKFNDICHNILIKHVPIILYNHDLFPFWLNKELKLLVKEGKKHSKYKKTKNNSNYITFSNLHLKCKHLSKANYINFTSKTTFINQ